jgi:SH3 domain protein
MIIANRAHCFGKTDTATCIFQAFRSKKRIIMKRLMIIGLSLFCLTSVCPAENATVTFSVWMRSGPGTEYETVSTIKSGETVEVMQQEKSWAQVRLKDGRQGWVSPRYLAVDAPADQLPESVSQAPRDPESVEAQNYRLQSEIAEKEKEIETIQQAYEQLKADSSEFTSVQSRLDTALVDLSKMKDQRETLQKKIADLQNDCILKGALIGAGILLVGILIGLNFKKQRRHSSLL